MLKKLGSNSPAHTVTYNDILNRHNCLEPFDGLDKGSFRLVMLPDGFDSKKRNGFMTAAIDGKVDEIIIPNHKGLLSFLEDERVRVALDRGIKISVLVDRGSTDSICTAYATLAAIDVIHAIVIPSDPTELFMESPPGYSRLQVVKDIVTRGLFTSDKKLHLMQLKNPAEIVAYRTWFSDYVVGSIDMVLSSSSFIAAMYGIRVSPYEGYFDAFEKMATMIGDSVPVQDLLLCDEQVDLFYLNKQVLDGFSRGIGGGFLVERYKAYEEEQSL